MPEISTRRRRLAIPLILAAALVLGLAALLALRVQIPGRARPAEQWVGAATPVALPAPAPSAVESLRRKTVAGEDRFVVEEADALLTPRLDALRAALLAPGPESRRAQLAAVLAGDFQAAPFIARGGRQILDAPSIAAFQADHGDGEPRPENAITSPGRFEEALAALIAPASRVRTAALKQLEIQGIPASGRLDTTVHFELTAATGGGITQWTGRLGLAWRAGSDAWRLSRWRTIDSVRVDLAARPFAEVTRDAIGANPSFAGIIARSLDDFRDTLDAATGIDVYGHHGLACGDADGDGHEDLYVCTPPGLPNLLYHGRGDGTFDDRSRHSGADALDGTYQALFLDLENDGDQDLFLVAESGIIRLDNDGRGRFTEASAGNLEAAASRSTPISAAAADYDRDGFVDVYVCAYVFWRGSAGEVGSRLPFPYHEAHNGAPNFLCRNRGDGSFDDVTRAARLDADNTRFSFAAGWGDADDDGDSDLYVANDFGSNNFYRNRGDGTFADEAALAGVEDVGAGMSVAWEDYDADGDLDLYVGNMLSSAGRRVTGTPDYKAGAPELQRLFRRHARGNSLFRNRGTGSFDDVSEPTRAYFGRWAWASGFVDFNLDGRDDIFVQNGFISNVKKDDL